MLGPLKAPDDTRQHEIAGKKVPQARRQHNQSLSLPEYSVSAGGLLELAG
jgi:hypothetical protein